MEYRFATGLRVHWIWDRTEAFGFLRRSWPILISGITAVIYVRLDVVMLTWWSSPEEAGIYSAAARLSEVWYFVPTLLMHAVFPGLLSLPRGDPAPYESRARALFSLLARVG